MANTDEIDEIAVQAYIYAYPLLLMELTRQSGTNVTAPIDSCAPMNQFAHLRTFPDATFKSVVRPNADTLYSSAWLDLSQEPMVLSVPETDRYYMMPMLDMWTDVVAAPGTRTTGNGAGNFAIIAPDWEGTLPENVQPIRLTTNLGWIGGRTQTNGTDDYEHVGAIQDQYKLTPLSQWGTPYDPPTSLPPGTCDTSVAPPDQVAAMDAETYFTLFAELLKQNAPHAIDWSIVQQLQKIGIVVGEDFDFASLEPEIQSALEASVTQGYDAIINKIESGDYVNGWKIAREFKGTYGGAYLQRAYVDFKGLGVNSPEDAIYPFSPVYQPGSPYTGSNNYVLHFDADELPPVEAFWSVTMYNSGGYFIDNPIDRYAIGDHDALQYNSDGSLDLYIQHDSPGTDKESNWLPAPADEFNVVMRLYWPSFEIMTGEWNPPPIKLVSMTLEKDKYLLD
ncbi:MAG: DUF1254 domain-containing protein [Okeania sp. SIO2D1]|nr:DUF1254 domain-containing protein [Okeania sp. SIO2D1]